MKLQRKLVLHYTIVVVACVLLSAGVSIAVGYFFGGFEWSVFGSPVVWPGIAPHSVTFMLACYTVSFVATFLLVVLLYARRMSAPIVMLVNGVDRLARGDYSDPCSLAGRSYPPGSLRLYGELTRRMTQLAERLRNSELESKQLETMRKEWASGVTHDLKTPLSYIHGYAAMLLSGDHAWTEEERSKFIAIVQEKAIHIERLIDDLGEAFRLESARIPLAPEPADIVAFVRQLLEDVRRQPAARGFELRFSADTDRLIYPIDEQLMRRALLNLLMNAVLHNPPGTAVTVTVAVAVESAEKLQITIADNGKGMSEEERKRLFERYYRGTSTDTPAGGTGLGMAIAKQLIAAHGGEIAVRSAIGQGTTITVALPLA